jgi:hypothetical protein
MTVDTWTLEAVEALGKTQEGATMRQIQRYIDEHRYEELAVDTLELSLQRLAAQGRVEATATGWRPAKKTSKEDALKRLFKED